ncbi:MAG: FGGY family carbohydrate kinase [Pirellulaceae bacterium]
MTFSRDRFAIHGAQHSVSTIGHATRRIAFARYRGAFLMVPDFLHWQLTGEKVNEFTNASTTQLLDVQSGNWSEEVLRSNFPIDLLDARSARHLTRTTTGTSS